MSDIPACLPDSAPGPDVIYSNLTGPVLQFDGACYSRPSHVVAISTEDDILITDTGTNLNDCARVECGPVALYCYESVDLPLSGMVAFQPEHFPAPIVTFAENRTRCYHNPAYIKTVFENYGSVVSGVGNTNYGSYAYPSESSNCGVGYLYTSCNGEEQIVVVNESSSTVYYAGKCWQDPVLIFNYGTEITVVSGTDTEVVTDCQDVLCTGSSSEGPSVSYVDQQLGNTVNVQFNNLDRGIPFYGVAPEKVDDGVNGLNSGEVSLSFNSFKTVQDLIHSVPASGRLSVTTHVPGLKISIVQNSAGTETVYELPRFDNAVVLDVTYGDWLRVEPTATLHGAHKIQGNIGGYAKWKSAPLSFRKFDEVELSYDGTTAINALGFCGIAAKTPYVFYGSLPAVSTSAYPNPDTYTTVRGPTGQEYMLVTCSTSGDVVPTGLDGVIAYSGQSVVGPLTFSFYTGRGNAGAHGEMDVWLDSAGTFPDALAAGAYSLLVKPQDWYRRSAQIGDTRRSSLTVAAEGETYTLPGIYVSSEGNVRVASGSIAPTITASGTTYTLAGTAYGLAYTVN